MGDWEAGHAHIGRTKITAPYPPGAEQACFGERLGSLPGAAPSWHGLGADDSYHAGLSHLVAAGLQSFRKLENRIKKNEASSCWQEKKKK